MTILHLRLYGCFFRASRTSISLLAGTNTPGQINISDSLMAYFDLSAVGWINTIGIICRRIHVYLIYLHSPTLEKMKIVLHLFLVSFLWIGCKTSKQNSSSGSSSNSTAKTSTSSVKNSDSPATSDGSKHVLDGNWFFISIPGKAVNYAEMFPNGMPAIDISVSASRASGFGGCNKYNTKVTVKGESIQFDKLVFLTRAACPSMGDQSFANAIENSTSYSVKGNELTLFNNKVEMMKLRKVN